jgi:hypothetical protein
MVDEERLPSGEDLISEIEDFLRDRGNGGTGGSGGSGPVGGAGGPGGGGARD